MKSLREQFEEDYAPVSVKADNKRGFKIRYVYDGPWYRWDLPVSVLKQKKQLLTGISVSGLLLLLLTGYLICALSAWYIFIVYRKIPLRVEKNNR